MDLDEFWKQVKEPMVVEMPDGLVSCMVVSTGFMLDRHYIWMMPYWEAES